MSFGTAQKKILSKAITKQLHIVWHQCSRQDNYINLIGQKLVFEWSAAVTCQAELYMVITRSGKSSSGTLFDLGSSYIIELEPQLAKINYIHTHRYILGVA